MLKTLVRNQNRLRNAAGPTTQGVDKRGRVWNGTFYFLAFTVVLVAAFAKPIVSTAVYVAHQELHSHILLVPFVFAYLIYLRRNELPEKYSSSFGWAVVLVLGATTALVTAVTLGAKSLSQNDYFSLMMVSFVCFFAAGGFLFLGREWMRAAAFPFFFLIFMAPMPDGMADRLETASKLASTEVADWFFSLSGTPFLRDGTRFQLPNILIQVGQECSGIRSSWVLVITSLLAANLFLKSTWRRAVLVCFVIPLGIIRNGFRVFVIGMLCVYVSPNMINSVIHHRGGPLFFALSLIPLFGLLWWLKRGEKPKREDSIRSSEMTGKV